MAEITGLNFERTPIDLAKEICKQFGLPYDGNLNRIADCITSFAHSVKLDLEGGFSIFVEKLKAAREQNMKLDRWFFQDGRYNYINISEAAPQKKDSERISSPIFGKKVKVN